MTFHWEELGHFAGAYHWAIAWAVGAAAVPASKYWQRLRENRAATWPSADATVQSATVRKKKNDWIVEISYRYHAPQGQREGKYRRSFRYHAGAEAFAAAMQGRHLLVRYKEDNPRVSVLTSQDLRLTGVLNLPDQPEPTRML